MGVRGYLSEYDIVIVKHTYTPTGGAEQELLRYLLPRAKSVVYVSHPFSDARGIPLNTSIAIYEQGEKRREIVAPLVKGPQPLFFLKDVLFTLWYLRKNSPSRGFRIYVGVDNLNAYTGLLLKRLGVVERVIYYVIDYAPQRFSNRFGQWLYQEVDKRCCYGSDAVWNVSASMEEARKEARIDANRCAPQLEVPLGNRYSEIQKLALEKKDPNLIVFLGSLTREQGLDRAIQAMPEMKRRLPNARLRIIGDGPECASLRNLAVEKGVSDAVEFMGFVEDDTEAARLAAEGAVGIAPYVQTTDTYKRLADPGKVKIYLAAGLPVIITRVPRIAGLIETREAGVIIEPNAGSLTDAVNAILSSPEKLRRLRANASELGKEYDWDTVFDRALEQTFEHWREKKCG